jgi:hypothetical protein
VQQAPCFYASIIAAIIAAKRNRKLLILFIPGERHDYRIIN